MEETVARRGWYHDGAALQWARRKTPDGFHPSKLFRKPASLQLAWKFETSKRARKRADVEDDLDA